MVIFINKHSKEPSPPNKIALPQITLRKCLEWLTVLDREVTYNFDKSCSKQISDSKANSSGNEGEEESRYITA